jgi:hypothetical protein
MRELKISFLFISLLLVSAAAYSSDIDLEKKNEVIAQYITEDPAENDINVVAQPSRKKGQKGGFFSNRVLYQTMLADPRKIQYSTGVRFKDTTWLNYETDPATGKRTGVIGADRAFWTFSLGDRIGLYLFDFGLGHSLQLEVEAGIWSVFSILEKGNPTGYNTIMLNTDFRVGVPITYSWNDFSFKFTYYHESSHLGDEFIKYGVAGNVFTLNQRANPSTEVLDLYLSYFLIKEIRIYSGIGVHLATDATYPVKPIYIDYGIELRPFDKWTIGSQAMLQLFAALHMRTVQDVSWDPDLTVVLGLELIPTGDDSRRRVRLYGEYHYGYSVEGQFSKNKTDYFNVMLAFGF